MPAHDDDLNGSELGEAIPCGGQQSPSHVLPLGVVSDGEVVDEAARAAWCVDRRRCDEMSEDVSVQTITGASHQGQHLGVIDKRPEEGLVLLNGVGRDLPEQRLCTFIGCAVLRGQRRDVLYFGTGSLRNGETGICTHAGRT